MPHSPPARRAPGTQRLTCPRTVERMVMERCFNARYLHLILLNFSKWSISLRFIAPVARSRYD